MDANRLDAIARALSGAPTRRHVTRAMAGLAAGTFLAPLPWLSEVEAKKKKKGKKKKKKKPDWERLCLSESIGKGPYCPVLKGPVPCCERREVCTEQGCCPAGLSKNCSTDTRYPDCFPDGSQCCLGPTNEYHACFPEDVCCGDGCCGQGGSGYGHCCHNKSCCLDVQGCCPDGSCSLYC